MAQAGVTYYPVVWNETTKESRRIHRVRAEQALGKPLPSDAVVHHVDGTKSATSPLVICQDERYHRLLHMRMRIVAAGGNPNTQKVCSRCRELKDKTAFNRRVQYVDGRAPYCRACLVAKRAEWPSVAPDYRSPRRRAKYAAGARNV